MDMIKDVLMMLKEVLTGNKYVLMVLVGVAAAYADKTLGEPWMTGVAMGVLWWVLGKPWVSQKV